MCLSQPLNENLSGENNSLPKISQKNEQRISSLGKVIYDPLISRLFGASVYHDQILLLPFVRWLLKYFIFIATFVINLFPIPCDFRYFLSPLAERFSCLTDNPLDSSAVNVREARVYLSKLSFRLA